ncbi:PAQR-type receptor Ecym_3031 [Eremothecium cymbalariae DBVPG|uniref:Uncharacterized protein n=1 Tax=Eremothecium cymbalariae (strain CBS 270.75 / DBVPG 7215 / KCTC 17166 / NRRL Y-17582) TaxID=931890 RepID=G8JQX7_ERECY|nr:Hypothetical protein Ecym_3031 [Eremothecium cymbalariae DBVPG\
MAQQQVFQRKIQKATSSLAGKNRTLETSVIFEDLNQATTIPLKPASKLFSWHEIPEWQRDNEHILGGYVKETNSFKETLHSLLYLHNESVNIYTHLIPGVCFFCVLFLNKYVISRFKTTTWKDYAIIDTFFVGAFACLVMSGTYHCLKSHSYPVSIVGNQLDYIGIVILISTSMFSLLYYGFYNSSKMFYGFSGVTLLLGTICTVVTLDSRFRSRLWRPYRASIFVAFGLSSILPILASILYYGSEETWNSVQLGWIILEGVLYIFGAFIYGIRFPESMAPGSFDIWGHSHQLFHVLVVIAALCHFKAVTQSYELVHFRLNEAVQLKL